ncbi:MAG: thiosulfate oxidation carrier complex protein SoxZ [Pseudomonadota bacterium]
MSSPMRIRAVEEGGVTTVRVLMAHVMETGVRRGADGNPIPAHYINRVEATHNGRNVLSANWGPAVSQNPFLAFRFRGAAKGDRVAVRWTDNRGGTRTDEAAIT